MNDDAATTKREQPLQAVLLADDQFGNSNRSFRPASLERPTCLNTLNNVVLMDYAIDWLSAAGVKELFVVCRSDAVEAHVEKQHQHSVQEGTHHGRMRIIVIKDSGLDNAGDALRILDQRNLVQSDPFLLLSDSVITNMNIQPALLQHKERYKQDSSAIMSMVFKPVEDPVAGASDGDSIGASTEGAPRGNGTSDNSAENNMLVPVRSSTRDCMTDLAVGFDPTQDNRILLYETETTSKSVSIPCSFFASHPACCIRTDMVDTGIDICSTAVLARFSDEFDYRDIRREFVANSVAEEEEGLQNKIYAVLAQPTEYAARVMSPATYAAVSLDLLRRWCYPVVPDMLPVGYERQYRYTAVSGRGRHYLYQERNCSTRDAGRHSNNRRPTTIERSSIVQGPGMVGASCIVGEDCRVTGSVLGHRVRVADRATVLSSHIWNDVSIGEGATIVQSILADGCEILPGAVVPRGCIIGANCVIGRDVVLPEFTRITLAKEVDEDFDDDWGESDDDDDSDSEDSEVKEEKEKEAAGQTDVQVVGADGRGRVWQPPEDDNVDDDDTENDDCLSAKEVVVAQSMGFDPTKLYRERYLFQQDFTTEEDDGFSSEDEDDTFREDDGNGDFMHSDDNGAVTFLRGGAGEAGTSGGGVFAEDYVVGRQKGVDVVQVAKTICLEHEPTTPVDNLAIELNSFKFSQNATYGDLTMAAIMSIVEQLPFATNVSDGKLIAEFKSHLNHWAPLFRKFCLGIDEEKAIVLGLEACATHATVKEEDVGSDNSNNKLQVMAAALSTGATFRFLLQTLHDQEFVREEAILAWAEERRQDIADAVDNNDSDDGDINKDKGAATSLEARRKKIFELQPLKDFLEWLEEEGEESSSEEEDEEGDDSEEED